MKTRPSHIEILQNRINDAADGALTPAEIAELEKELKAHPGLLHDYQNIINLPDFSGIYGDLNAHRHADQLSEIYSRIEQSENRKSETAFEHIAVLWFKRYAIAASFLILTVTSVFNLSQPAVVEADIAFDELFYPVNDTAADEYVTYLNEWIEP